MMQFDEHSMLHDRCLELELDFGQHAQISSADQLKTMLRCVRIARFEQISKEHTRLRVSASERLPALRFIAVVRFRTFDRVPRSAAPPVVRASRLLAPDWPAGCAECSCLCVAHVPTGRTSPESPYQTWHWVAAAATFGLAALHHSTDEKTPPTDPWLECSCPSPPE